MDEINGHLYLPRSMLPFDSKRRVETAVSPSQGKPEGCTDKAFGLPQHGRTTMAISSSQQISRFDNKFLARGPKTPCAKRNYPNQYPPIHGGGKVLLLCARVRYVCRFLLYGGLKSKGGTWEMIHSLQPLVGLRSHTTGPRLLHSATIVG